MKLKEARLSAGLSQQEFAKMMGVSQPTVGRWESGKSEISRSKLQLASEILKQTKGQLTGELDYQNPNLSSALQYALKGDLWGTLKIDCKDTVREYPICNETRSRLSKVSLDMGLDAPWFEVATLDNRILLINSDNIDRMELICDDEEAAPPYFESECYDLVSTPSSHGANLSDDEKNTIGKIYDRLGEGADDVLDNVTVFLRDTNRAAFFLDEDSFRSILLLMNCPNDLRLLEVPTDYGVNSIIFFPSRIAWMEIPKAKFSHLCEELADE